jgi:hypothetical protein
MQSATDLLGIYDLVLTVSMLSLATPLRIYYLVLTGLLRAVSVMTVSMLPPVDLLSIYYLVLTILMLSSDDLLSFFSA